MDVPMWNKKCYLRKYARQQVAQEERSTARTMKGDTDAERGREAEADEDAGCRGRERGKGEVCRGPGRKQTRCEETEPAPDDWPKIVTLVGSPPKAAMCRWTHRMASPMIE